MSDEKKTYRKFTLAERKAGGEKLVEALSEVGIKSELKAEPGRTPEYDSVRVRVMDKAGVPAGDLCVNGKGFINLGYRYTAGDQKVIARAMDAAAELQGGDVSEFKVKVKDAPGGGAPFLQQLEDAN